MRNAVRTSLFESQDRREKQEGIGDPLSQFERHLDFSAITARVEAAPPAAAEGWASAVSDGGDGAASGDPAPEPVGRAAGIPDAVSRSGASRGWRDDIPDRNTVLWFRECIARAGAADVVFNEVNRQLMEHGCIARCGQIIDAQIGLSGAESREIRPSKWQYFGQIPGVNRLPDSDLASKAVNRGSRLK